MNRVSFDFPMLTRVIRENEKCSKTANLCINLMKVDERRFLDIAEIYSFFWIFSIISLAENV